MCLDTTKLNKSVIRERYQYSTPHEQVATIESNQAEIFTTFDEFQSYHICELDVSEPLTTFIAPYCGQTLICPVWAWEFPSSN